ncbi:MAG: HD domain-containing protein [Oribacterium sp.]|nr:HD domain-containing protein [Oribacterium sp.]MDY6316539.1 HD domain-containing protein [Oribacterium sp.]
MKINRDHVKEAFAKYVSDYDMSDVKIKLKYDHTYRVAEMCDAITATLDMTPEDRDIAWLTGMLHDIGRFEQLRRYHTFQDRRSVNHAALSADILFKNVTAVSTENEKNKRDEIETARIRADENRTFRSQNNQREIATKNLENNKIRLFVEDPSEDALLEKAIRLHNVYILPSSLTEREYRFCTILRDADKIDILRVNCETPRTEIYDLPEEAFHTSSISDHVYADIMACKNVNRDYSKTAIDYMIGHMGFVFGLVYQESFRQVKKQGYLDQMLSIESSNPDTAAKLVKIRDSLHQYIDSNL